MRIMASNNIGKCPKCNKYLNSEDIDDVKFRGYSYDHLAYVCQKYHYIIGFGSRK